MTGIPKSWWWYRPALILGIVTSGIYMRGVIHEAGDLATPERFQARCGKAPSASTIRDVTILDYGTVLVKFKGRDSAVFIYNDEYQAQVMLSQAMTYIGCRHVPSL